MAILTNKKFLWGVIILLIVLNLLSLSAIWRTRDRKPMFNQKSNISRQDHFLHRKLNFSAEQQVSFDSLITEQRRNLSVVMKEIGTFRKSLIESIQSDNNVNIDSLVKQIGDKQMVLEKINYNHFKEVLSICNSDQKKEFLKIMDRAVMPDRRYDRSKRSGREQDTKRFR